MKRNLEALRLLVQILGPEWGFVVSDPVEGDPGNDERLGYLCDLRRVRPSGLAGELVVPDVDLRAERAVMKQQWARTASRSASKRGARASTLVTLHILSGNSPADRTPELRGAAKWLAEQADDPDEFNRNLIALGDFNIDKKDDALWKAFTEQGLTPPPEFDGKMRTLPTKDGKGNYYDQIAWFVDRGRARLTLDYAGNAGNFEWDRYVFPGFERTDLSYRMSDHYPLWCEFLLPERD